jgi:hypothetical protein
MRARNVGLTDSGLLIARDTDAVDTPARVATARMPCFDGLLRVGTFGPRIK